MPFELVTTRPDGTRGGVPFDRTRLTTALSRTLSLRDAARLAERVEADVLASGVGAISEGELYERLGRVITQPSVPRTADAAPGPASRDTLAAIPAATLLPTLAAARGNAAARRATFTLDRAPLVVIVSIRRKHGELEAYWEEVSRAIVGDDFDDMPVRFTEPGSYRVDLTDGERLWDRGRVLLDEKGRIAPSRRTGIFDDPADPFDLTEWGPVHGRGGLGLGRPMKPDEIEQRGHKRVEFTHCEGPTPVRVELPGGEVGFRRVPPAERTGSATIRFVTWTKLRSARITLAIGGEVHELAHFDAIGPGTYLVFFDQNLISEAYKAEGHERGVIEGTFVSAEESSSEGGELILRRSFEYQIERMIGYGEAAGVISGLSAGRGRGIGFLIPRRFDSRMSLSVLGHRIHYKGVATKGRTAYIGCIWNAEDGGTAQTKFKASVNGLFALTMLNVDITVDGESGVLTLMPPATGAGLASAQWSGAATHEWETPNTYWFDAVEEGVTVRARAGALVSRRGHGLLLFPRSTPADVTVRLPQPTTPD